MRRFAPALMGAVALCSAAGCIAPPQGEPHAVGSAPPIAGTLYVFHPSDTSDGQPVVEIFHDGKRFAHRTPGDVFIARDKPAVRLSAAPLFGSKRLNPRSCEPIALSADGTYGACLRSDGFGTVAIFRLADPAHSQ